MSTDAPNNGEGLSWQNIWYEICDTWTLLLNIYLGINTYNNFESWETTVKHRKASFFFGPLGALWLLVKIHRLMRFCFYVRGRDVEVEDKEANGGPEGDWKMLQEKV
ncbi:hypothetical protein GLAREA_03193 [Glarea lozoyensis ATCC 20868]|uniref:Uncharacterized protein n=1 Tax=Glarea lozoyensis (strain ATCC 20868 / MF5171) TaxID=1116229 RepID=S3DL68_GLAL2|nr:uncharacterized protein GLAREA_03193 [Glarea lozoyensis ATCC 20868]EPE27278.1 hypothetical protein GLAREA_03193 [Glarea lozoyensis ATCC 20868]